MNPLNGNSCVRYSPNVHFKKIGEETVLLDIETGNYYTLNLTAGEIWSFCGEPRSVDEIARFLGSRYDLSPQMAAADAASYLKKLLAENLLELEPR